MVKSAIHSTIHSVLEVVYMLTIFGSCDLFSNPSLDVILNFNFETQNLIYHATTQYRGERKFFLRLKRPVWLVGSHWFNNYFVRDKACSWQRSKIESIFSLWEPQWTNTGSSHIRAIALYRKRGHTFRMNAIFEPFCPLQKRVGPKKYDITLLIMTAADCSLPTHHPLECSNN